jgi:hypothetical protein
MDWSPSGVTDSGSCVIVVCTADHRVSVHAAARSPLATRWIQLIGTISLYFLLVCEDYWHDMVLILMRYRYDRSTQGRI